MASSLVDLVKINVSNSGAGAITLGSAVEGYRGRDVLTNGTVYSYSIQQGSAWEFGRGTYLAESAQLIRSVIDSSDGGAALNLKPNAQIAFTALSADLMPQVQLTTDMQAKVDAATAAQAASETAQGLAEDARDTSVAAKDISVTKAEEASASATAANGFRVRAGNSIPFATWTALAAATGMAAGDRASVLSTDTGTHTDPVAGGTVNNAGVFTYSASPAGWQRTGDLDSAAVAVGVAAAATSATNAGISASTASAASAVPRDNSNWLLYNLEAKTLTRPALVTTETINTGGDSTVNGTGAPTGFSWPAQLNAMVTGGGSVVNGGIGGTTSAQMLATFTAASAAVKGQHQIVSTGLNDLSTLIGNRRDWALGGYTKGNIASYKALITGGKQLCIILALRSDDSAPGQKSGADYTFHYRDMIATYGADAINVHRYSVHVAERSGPDWFVTQRDFGVPLSKQGQGTQAIGVNNAAHFDNAGTPASLAYDADRIVWDTSGLKWKRKIGATGAGSWADTDRKHRSRWGYADVAANARDWLLAMTGQGAPYAPPQEFRCGFDVAAGAVIGTVAIRTSTSAFGSADRAEIVAGNDDSVFTIDPFGRIYRSRLGTLQRKIYTLIVKLTGANGYYSLAIVDIFVGRASTQTLPQRLLIPEPVCLYGSEGHATASSKYMSGACWMRFDAAYSSAPFIITGLTGAQGSGAQFHVKLTNDAATSTGRLQISLTNAAGTNFFFCTSVAQNAGGVGIPRNTWGWLTWAVDLTSGGAPVAYWNDTPLTWSSVTTSNQDMPWADPSIMFLNARALSGGDRTGSSPLTGGCGYLAWWNSYIDWTSSARRRELFTDANTPFITNTTGTINGAAAAQVAVQGEPVDLRWGGFNANQLVQINHDALRTMSIV